MEDLEEISDTATSTEEKEFDKYDITIDENDDDGPEEGEISDDDVTVEREVKPLSSEVVIYNDHGRTAIFTSPTKGDNSWKLSRYSQYEDERHSHKNEVPKRKRDRVRHGERKTRRKSRKLNSSGDRGRHRIKPRSQSSDIESICSSCSDCSCSSSRSNTSSTTSSSSSDSGLRIISTKKTRGKVKKQSSSSDRNVPLSSTTSHFKTYFEEHHDKRDIRIISSSTLEKSHTTARKKTQSHSPPQSKEVRRLSPTIYGRTKYSSRSTRSPVRALHSTTKVSPKGPSRVESTRRNSKGKLKVSKTDSKRKSSRGSNTSKDNPSRRKARESEKEIVDLTLGDSNTPPRPGSLGEMLLKKTKKGMLKVGRKTCHMSEKTPTENKADSVNENSELPTKSIASPSEDVVTIEDGEKVSTADEYLISGNMDQEDEDELQLRLIALRSSLKVLSDVRREGQVGMAQLASPIINGSAGNPNLESTKESTQNERKFSPLEDVILKCIFERDSLSKDSKVLGSKRRSRSKSIHDNTKEASDSNQDIIDMEICDSSPEEEDTLSIVEDVLKEVGEDIAFDDDGLLKTREDLSSENYQANNFQMPVEWAYMMPPPPPPDQPDNDISNINSWCYDQNMYLQSMQGTPCPPSDETVPYSQVQHHMQNDWPQSSNNNNEMAAKCYPQVNDSLKEHSSNQGNSIFYQDKSVDFEQDLTSDLLNLPKNSGFNAAVKSSSQVHYDEDQEESLKDQPAHQYQAFMHAVLQNTQVSPSNPERTLVQVNMETPANAPHQQAKPSKNSQNIKGFNRTLVNVNVDKTYVKSPVVEPAKSKNYKAIARKRRKERKKLEKQKAAAEMFLAKMKDTLTGLDLGSVNENIDPSNHEEEDEDLLRAQLLIDLSKKKQQKEEAEKVISVATTKTRRLELEEIAANQKSFLFSKVNRKIDHNSSPPCSYPSSAESSPKIRPSASYSKSKRNVLPHQGISKEGSPTHLLRKEPRNLSDIGGVGLDPKHSRYEFTDLNNRKDIPKFKFPPIKPVIIYVGPDSSDDEENDGQAKAVARPDKLGVSVKTSDPFSTSLDSLLKGIRAKSASNTPNKPIEAKSKAIKGSANATPNAVRHLSRNKQAEYHRLKEQLREKENLQRKRLQQLKKVTTKKVKVAASASSAQFSNKTNKVTVGGLPAMSLDLQAINPSNQSIALGSTTVTDNNLHQGDSVTQNENASKVENVMGKKSNLQNKSTRKVQNATEKESNLPNEMTSKVGNITQSNLPNTNLSIVASDTEKSSVPSELSRKVENFIERIKVQIETSSKAGEVSKKIVNKVEPNSIQNAEDTADLPSAIVSKNDNGTKKQSKLENDDDETTKKVSNLISSKADDVHQLVKEVNITTVGIIPDPVNDEKSAEICAYKNVDLESASKPLGEEKPISAAASPVQNDDGDDDDMDALRLMVLQSISKKKSDKQTNNDAKIDNTPVPVDNVEVTSQSDLVLKSTSNESEEEMSTDDNKKTSIDEMTENPEHVSPTNIEEGIKTIGTDIIGVLDKTSESDDSVLESKALQDIYENNKSETLRDVCENNERGVSQYIGENNGNESSQVTLVGETSQYIPETNHTSNRSCLPSEQLQNISEMNDHDSNDSSFDRQTFLETQETNKQEKMPFKSTSESESKESVIFSRGQSNCLKDQNKDLPIKTPACGQKTEKIIGRKSTSIPNDAVSTQTTKMGKELIINAAIPETKRLLKARAENSLQPSKSASGNPSVEEVSSANCISPVNGIKKKSVTSSVVFSPNKIKMVSADDRIALHEKQKKLALLERLKKDYIDERASMSNVMQKLAKHIQEATDEERDRQNLMQSIGKLRTQLAKMESQLEERSGNLKSKMQTIRKLQSQMTNQRQLIKELESKGETLGKEVIGSDYSLPKVHDSPKRKKNLADNIHALRQQMRDVCNKSKANLQAAKAKSSVQVVRSKAESTTSQIGNSNSNNKNAIKTLQEGNSSHSPIVKPGITPVGSVKRKGEVAAVDTAVKKLAKNSIGKGFAVKRADTVETKTKNNEKDTAKSQSSPHTGRMLDEMNELCPYDLLGRCNDDLCTYQHLSQHKCNRVSMPDDSEMSKTNTKTKDSNTFTTIRPDEVMLTKSDTETHDSSTGSTEMADESMATKSDTKAKDSNMVSTERADEVNSVDCLVNSVDSSAEYSSTEIVETTIKASEISSETVGASHVNSTAEILNDVEAKDPAYCQKLVETSRELDLKSKANEEAEPEVSPTELSQSSCEIPDSQDSESDENLVQHYACDGDSQTNISPNEESIKQTGADSLMNIGPNKEPVNQTCDDSRLNDSPSELSSNQVGEDDSSTVKSADHTRDNDSRMDFNPIEGSINQEDHVITSKRDLLKDVIDSAQYQNTEMDMNEFTEDLSIDPQQLQVCTNSPTEILSNKQDSDCDGFLTADSVSTNSPTEILSNKQDSDCDGFVTSDNERTKNERNLTEIETSKLEIEIGIFDNDLQSDSVSSENQDSSVNCNVDEDSRHIKVTTIREPDADNNSLSSAKADELMCNGSDSSETMESLYLSSDAGDELEKADSKLFSQDAEQACDTNSPRSRSVKRGRQARSRGRGVSSPVTGCRRGRSRMSNTDTSEGEGVSSQSKRGKTEKATRARRSRGRTPRCKRASR